MISPFLGDTLYNFRGHNEAQNKTPHKLSILTHSMW